MTWQDNYQVRVDRIEGGCEVWVTSRRTGVCLWWLRLAWPLSRRGLAEIQDWTPLQVPGLKAWELKREIEQQMRERRPA